MLHLQVGIAVTLAGHPFDTAKVRLQTQSSTNPIYCKPATCPFAVRYLVAIAKSQEVRGVWQDDRKYAHHKIIEHDLQR